MSVFVVRDTPDALVTYVPGGAPLGFPEGPWPTPDGRHAWSAKTHWQGHGVLMAQEPGASYAVWHFWSGPERAFAGWYVNLQAPFRRTAIGYDTQDLELDIWIPRDGPWTFKDMELLDVRADEGRWSRARAAEIRALGHELGARLARGERLWDEDWSTWVPDPAWRPPDALPDGWDRVGFDADDVSGAATDLD